jgi:hypothetical protein
MKRMRSLRQVTVSDHAVPLTNRARLLSVYPMVPATRNSAANAVALNASQRGLHIRPPQRLYRNHHHVTTPATTTTTAISCSMTSNSTAPRTSSGTSRLE